MLLLTSPGEVIHLTINPVVVVAVHASYLDHLLTQVTPGRQNIVTTSQADVDIVSPPVGTSQRSVKTLSIRNLDPAVTSLITVQHKDASVTADLRQLSLKPGQTLAFTEGQGFRVYDADGTLI